MSDDDPQTATGTASEAEPIPALPLQKDTEPDWAKTENEADPKEAVPMQKPAPTWAQTVPAPPGESLDEAPEIAHVRSIPDQEDVAPAPSSVPEATDIWPPDPPTEHTMPAWPPSSSLKHDDLPAPSTIPSSTEPWADSFDGVAASGTKPAVPPAKKTQPPAATKPPAASKPPAATVPPAAKTVPPAVMVPPEAPAKTVPAAASTPPPKTASPAPPADAVWGSVTASAPGPKAEPAAPPEPVAPPEKASAPPAAAAALKPPAEPPAPSQPPAAPSIDWPDAVPIPAWAPRVHIGSTRTDEWTPASQPAPRPAPQPVQPPAAEKAPTAAQPAAPQAPAAQPAAHAPSGKPAATPTGTPTKGWSWGIVEQKKSHEPAKVSPTPEDRSYAEWFAWAKRGGAPAGACHAAAQGAFQALASGKDVATAVQWATAAMTKPPAPVSGDRQAYCAWFSLANIDLNLDQHKAHAFATAAVHALDRGADAASAHAAGLAAAGVR